MKIIKMHTNKKIYQKKLNYFSKPLIFFNTSQMRHMEIMIYFTTRISLKNFGHKKYN